MLGRFLVVPSIKWGKKKKKKRDKGIEPIDFAEIIYLPLPRVSVQNISTKKKTQLYPYTLAMFFLALLNYHGIPVVKTSIGRGAVAFSYFGEGLPRA